MAPKTRKMAISAALDELVDRDLERFCSQLLDRKKKRVPESFVMGKSRVQITAALVQTYTEEGAVKVVLETLKDAGFGQTAKNFEKAIQKLTKPKRKSKAGGASASAAGGRAMASDPADEMDSADPAVSFILGQKMKLITCLGADDDILQFAQQEKVITLTQYRKLKSIPSADDAVTALIDVVVNKGPAHCRRFLQILKEPNVVDTYPLLEKIMKDWN